MLSKLNCLKLIYVCRRSTVYLQIYLERITCYQILSEALVQSRKAVQLSGLRMGQAFDARSEVMPESVLNSCNYNTRETLKSAAL